MIWSKGVFWLQELSDGTLCYQLFLSENWEDFRQEFIKEVEERDVISEVIETKDC